MITKIVEILQYIAFFCWSCFSAFTILGLIAQVYKPKMADKKADNVDLVIVSVATAKVEKSLMECITDAKKFGCKLWVVVDEGAELIPRLREELGDSLVIVPASYRPDLIGKGRAINYFVDNVVSQDRWYAFIDDDNLILDDAFLYEIPYYEKEGYVAMNPILVPRNGRCLLTYIMDFVRYFDDILVYRSFTGLMKRPLVGFHGELLTVKGRVLKEIGFGHASITEDFRFASELVRRGYKVWQSRTRVSIKSPNSVMDLLKQRGRWFNGIISDYRYCPILMKVVVSLRMILWILGIFGSWSLSPLWLLWKAFYWSIPGGICYLVMYAYGVIKSRRLLYFVFIPIFGIIETISFIAGLRRQKNFVVIDKN